MGVASGFADLVSGFSEKLATDDKSLPDMVFVKAQVFRRQGKINIFLPSISKVPVSPFAGNVGTVQLKELYGERVGQGKSRSQRLNHAESSNFRASAPTCPFILRALSIVPVWLEREKATSQL